LVKEPFEDDGGIQTPAVSQHQFLLFHFLHL
jgi:hypothetical protein